MVSLADAYVRIRPDTSGLDADGIAKPASEMGKKAGEEAGKSFGISFSSLLKTAGIAAAGLATGQIAGFFKSTIEAASDVSEAQNKVQVVFGKSTQAVLDFGKTSSTSLGLSKASYLDAVGTLGNLFVALKLPGPEAAKMSTSMVQLAGDLASFNNTSPEDALEALRSGLVGETEPLRQYGVNINAATLQTEAMKLGLIDNIKTALTPAQKAQATYALVLDQTKTAQGDFQRTSGGLANQQRILKAQFDDLKSTIGSALLPAFTDLVHVVTEKVVPGIRDFIAGVQGKGELEGFSGRLNVAGRGVWAFVQSFKDGQVVSTGFVGDMERMGVAARQIVDDIRAFAGVLIDNKGAILTFVGAIVLMKGTIEAVILVQKAWAAIQTAIAFVQLASQVRSLSEAWVLLDAAMDANPIGIVVIAIAALAAGLVFAWTHSETFRDVVTAVFDAVKAAVLFLWHNVFEPWWQGLVTIFNNIVAGAQEWYGGLQSAFTNVSNAVQAVGGFFQSMWNVLVSVFNGIVSAAQTWWTGMKVIFDFVVAAVQVLAAPFLWLWHSIFEPVFAVLGTIVKDFYIIFYDIVLLVVQAIQVQLTNTINGFKLIWSAVWGAISDFTKQSWAIVQAVWQAIVSYLSGPLSAANNALHALWQSVWNAIVSVATTTWNGIKAIWDAIVNFLGGPLSSANNAFHNVFQTAWNAISNVAETVWNKIKGFWDAMSNFITNTLPNAFNTGVDAISRFWNALGDKVKAPINFVIGFINRGIISPINGLVSTFGGTALSTIPTLASGGLIRGPGTGTSDSILGLSQGGMATARVSNGEFVVNAAQTKKHYGMLQALNSGVEGFALGGLVGDVIGLVTDPIGTLSGGLGDLASSIGNSGFAQMLLGVPKKLIEWAGKWIKDKFTSLLGGTTPTLGGPGGDSVNAILSWARVFDPTASVSSGYRPGAADYHGQGLAADIIGANMDGIAQGFYGMSSHLLELIHSPSWFVKNGIRVGPDFYASVFAEHFNHVHVAAYANALGFANGGTINEPVWGIGKSGRRYTFGEYGPETVTPGVNGAIGGAGGVSLTINVAGDVGDAQVRAIKGHVDDAFRALYVQMKTGRRR